MAIDIANATAKSLKESKVEKPACQGYGVDESSLLYQAERLAYDGNA